MKRAGQKDVVILAAKRTPFGTFGGALKDLTATDLAVHAANAAIAQAGVPVEDYGHVVMGNVAQTSADAIYLARHVGLRAGLPQHVPALTVNRLCGSGFEAVIQAAMLIETRRGGAGARRRHRVDEPGAARRCAARASASRSGSRRAMEDMLWSALTDSYAGMPMALTAEKLAEQYRIGQDEVDEYAVLSQRRWAAAHEAGRFREELAPVEVKGKKGPVLVRPRRAPAPRHHRRGAPQAAQGVQARTGVIHAGAASGIADGAGALVLASRAYAERRGADAARAARELGPRRGGPDHHGHRPGAGDPERARARRRDARATSTSSR